MGRRDRGEREDQKIGEVKGGTEGEVEGRKEGLLGHYYPFVSLLVGIITRLRHKGIPKGIRAPA